MSVIVARVIFIRIFDILWWFYLKAERLKNLLKSEILPADARHAGWGIGRIKGLNEFGVVGWMLRIRVFTLKMINMIIIII